MTNVLIRDVPEDDLEEVRSAAAAEGTSLQSYLRGTVHAQAGYLRRQDALAATSRRLHGRPEVPPEEAEAVLDAVAGAHDDRAEQLSDRFDS